MVFFFLPFWKVFLRIAHVAVRLPSPLHPLWSWEKPECTVSLSPSLPPCLLLSLPSSHCGPSMADVHIAILSFPATDCGFE